MCARRELFKIELHGFVFVSKSELVSYSQTASYTGIIMMIPFIYISEYQQQYLNNKCFYHLQLHVMATSMFFELGT